jgi:C1A family cysteine protease
MNTLVKSPQDNRDWIYEGLSLTAIPTPEELDLRQHLQPVRNQGQRGTCAAFSSSTIKEYHEKLDHVEFDGYISPDSIYFYRVNKPSEGMYCRDIMSILTKHGAAREQFQPYSSKEPKTLSAECIQDAKQFTIKGYAQINTIPAAKQALMTNGPLLIAFPYYDNGFSQFWRPKGTLAGGHAVAVVGWTKDGFIIRNSWGDKWNGDGHVIYLFNEFGHHWEIWSCIDLETEWSPAPKPNPTPAPIPTPAPAPKPRRVINIRDYIRNNIHVKR